MGKPVRIIRNVLCIAAGVIAVITVALQIALNSGLVPRVVDDALAKNIDADVEYSRIGVSLLKAFPRIRVSLDSVYVTYPHDRYADFDKAPVRNGMLAAGRGEMKDTLARFDRFTAAVNVWRILGGRLRLCDASLDGLALYAHSYNDTTANWNVFKASDEAKDTTSSSVSLPWISVGDIIVGGSPSLVYTAQQDTVFATLGFDRFLVRGDVKIGRDGFKLKDALVDLDSLFLVGRLPADSVDVRLDYLDVSEPLFHKFDIGLGAAALVVTDVFGRLNVPVRIDGRAGFVQDGGITKIDLDRLDAELAYIPVHAEGIAKIYGDSTYVKASAAIRQCSLGKLLEQYASSFVESAADFRTDAVLDLSAEAEGVISEGRIPAVKASLNIPESNVYYAPLEIPARLALDLEGNVSPRLLLNAVVNELKASAPGLELDLGAKGFDILGDDPRFKLDAIAAAGLDTLMRFVPPELGIRLEGDLNIGVDADARLSQIVSYKFDEASVNGRVDGNRLSFEMPDDTLKASLHKPSVRIGSGNSGLTASINADSVYFASGADLVAKVRGMTNSARLYKTEVRGKLTPRLEFSNNDRSLYLRSGSSNILIGGADISAAAEKRVRMNSERRKQYLDSLQRVYPGVPRNELFAKAHRGGEKAPDYLKSRDLPSGDVDISLDSTITRYLRQWTPYGKVTLGRGFVATPAFPLRTRLWAFSGEFDGRDLSLDTLAVTAGSSDIAAHGRVTGLGRALMRKGALDMGLDIHSRRLNVNELLAALELGKNSEVELSGENDESFVVDTLTDARPDSSAMSLIVVPSNLSAELNLLADRVDYTDITASPVSASINLKDRTLQLCNTSLSSDIGNIDLDAFYSTKSLSDISAGANIKMKDMSAEGIIHLIPGVDDMMPALKSFKGLLGCEVSATTQLDTNMNVVIPSLDGLIRISGENLKVEDAGDLQKITRLLLFKDKNIGDIDNLYVDAIIHDSKVEVFPFELGVDRYKLALRGMQGLDKSMNYHVSILRSPFLVRFGVNIFGTLDNWRFNLTLPKYREGNMPQFTQELDEMHVNILDGIRNIFQRGKNGVDEYNRKAFQAIDDKKSAVMYYDTSDSRELTFEEYLQIDSLAFEYETQQWEAELMEEIDSVLDESYEQMEKIMKLYAEATYDKSVERQLARMKRKEEKKKNK